MPGPASIRLTTPSWAACAKPASRSKRRSRPIPSDAYIYGFALQEKTVPFDSAEDAAALAQEQARQLQAEAEEQQLAALGDEYPYIAEVVAGHVARVGYDFGHAFEYGLDLILDALEQRRGSP